MNRVLAILVLLGTVDPLSAHRLDECLQAVRVRVQPGQIMLSAQITPGMEIVERFLAVIDDDRDGSISDDETRCYAAQWLRDVGVALNNRSLKLELTDIEVPPVSEMRQGTGVIRIEVRSRFPPLSPGPHRLTLTNAHLSALSVHLVNVVKPESDKVAISKQTRNETQSEYRLDFTVHRGSKPFYGTPAAKEIRKNIKAPLLIQLAALDERVNASWPEYETDLKAAGVNHTMRRRTFQQLRSKHAWVDHHNVYVVLLDAAVGKLRRVRSENPARDPGKPCVYVGMTGLTKLRPAATAPGPRPRPARAGHIRWP